MGWRSSSPAEAVSREPLGRPKKYRNVLRSARAQDKPPGRRKQRSARAIAAEPRNSGKRRVLPHLPGNAESFPLNKEKRLWVLCARAHDLASCRRFSEKLFEPRDCALRGFSCDSVAESQKVRADIVLRNGLG